MSFTGVLLIILAVVLALATFIESAYGIPVSWALVYGTHWFEVLFLLISLNLAGVMVKYKFLNRRKLVVLVFHLAFITILLGAAITRFISYEGIMHIREGSMSSTMLSDDAYMNVVLEKDGEKREYEKSVMLTELTPGAYRLRAKAGDEKVKIRSVEYIANATEQWVAGPGGEAFYFCGHGGR